jgi:hypothetical protein
MWMMRIWIARDIMPWPRLGQRTHQPLERQLNFYGGLKWRYEEFVPCERRRIDRMAVF